jgi:hypothetical protein
MLYIIKVFKTIIEVIKNPKMPKTTLEIQSQSIINSFIQSHNFINNITISHHTVNGTQQLHYTIYLIEGKSIELRYVANNQILDKEYYIHMPTNRGIIINETTIMAECLQFEIFIYKVVRVYFQKLGLII